MKYVRVTTIGSGFQDMVGEVVEWDADREVLWVEMGSPFPRALQFRPKELEEISEREYLAELAARVLGVRP